MKTCSAITALVAAIGFAAPAGTVVTLSPTDTGRTFEGVGAVSAGASTRNLVDYPEKQRAAVLDFLFRPQFGASLQHLKVEIGGGENSTCGSEPSHAVTRDEMKAPHARGYEFWFMAEARKRNPSIQLDCLPWCYPHWLSGRFSQDSAEWFAAFLEVAKKDYGLQLNWVAAAQNEMGTELEWIVNTLRPTLDARGFANVQLQAPDDTQRYWEIYQQFSTNPAAARIVQATGYHYPSKWLPEIESNLHPATAQAIASGKPLWASEEFSYSGRDWDKALLWAQLLNKNYIQSRITKTEVWCPVDSIYVGIPYAGTGLMQAATPWSGHYEVWPAIWTTAHTTQFAEPGWRYLDHACGQIDSRTWKGSYVTLANPATHDWSMIVCTESNVTFHLQVADGLKHDVIHLWKSDAKQQFQQLAALVPSNGIAELALAGDSVYSLTTTTGQHKGTHPPPPAAQSFPLPYFEDFDSYAAGKSPRYFSDQKGTFETAARPDGKGMCLKQIVPAQGILWYRTFRLPYTVLGENAWRDYTVQADVLVASGSVEVGGRFGDEDVLSYSLALTRSGEWALVYHGKRSQTVNGKAAEQVVADTLASGTIKDFKPVDWHTLRLSFSGEKITAAIEGRQVAEVTDNHRQSGMAYLASSYDSNCFDNVSISPR